MTTTTRGGLATRAAERPLPTALALGRAGLPYALGAYIAYIFLWYLPYKFYPGNHVFETLEAWSGLPWVEPYLRYWVGGAEAVASFLLLVPGVQLAGAAMALGIMSGAISFHLFTPLGVDPFNDGGKLFTEACTVWGFAVAILVMRRREILPLLARLATDPRLPRIVANAA
jgi:hypothetical protein